MSMAQLTLIGNLGKEPEMSYTPASVAVTKFSIAVTSKVGDKNETTWYSCTAFRGLAETINTHVRKGQQVFVQGRFTPRAYTTKDGRPGVSYDVLVDNFQFIGNKPPATTGAGDSVDSDPLGDLDNEHPF